jgi:hypothetical protein
MGPDLETTRVYLNTTRVGGRHLSLLWHPMDGEHNEGTGEPRREILHSAMSGLRRHVRRPL